MVRSLSNTQKIKAKIWPNGECKTYKSYVNDQTNMSMSTTIGKFN